jgi:hypothetical protein
MWMVYNFVTKKPRTTVIIWKKSSPRDYHLFRVVYQNIVGHKSKDREVGTGVRQWLIRQGTDFCQQRAEGPVPRRNKCLRCGREYVKYWWDSSTIRSELFLLDLNIKSPEILIFTNLLSNRPS